MQCRCKQFAKIGSGLVGLAVLLVALGALNAVVGNLRLRHDFTEEKLYTLSDGSRAVLSKLPSDVVLKLYFSRSMGEVPTILKTYADHVEDLLKEYELASKGRVTVETYDPKPDSDEEEWALKYGISPQPVNAYGEAMYFGIVAAGETAEEVIPALSPRGEATLEYEITRMISRAVNAEKPVLGVLSPLPVLGDTPPAMMGMPPRRRAPAWVAFGELQRDYDVRTVPVDAAEIPADVTTLLLVHPRDLSDATLYAIDQFALRGGRILALVDPFSIAELASKADDPAAMYGGADGPSTLGKLFDAWGIGFDTSKVVADLRAVTTIGGGGHAEESPVVLSLTSRNLSRDALLTSRLDQMLLVFAGEIVDRTPDGVEFEPLIVSSDSACLVDAFGARAGMQAIRAQLRPDQQKHVLAARVNGVLPSAFPDGPPAPADTNAPPATAEHLAQGTAPAALIVVGDADFLSDDAAVQRINIGFGMQAAQPRNDNLAFFLNAVEQVSGNQDLIAIRSRGRFNRPFDRVDDLEAKARAVYQEQEEQLSRKLMETRRQIVDLQRQKEGNQALILSKEQQDAIDTFRATEIETHRQLREVRKNLRKDIDTLGVKVKFVNIALMPILVVLVGIGVAIARRQRT
ncbi:MAG: Gldg family protein [Kiritimatiellia bacterium]|jgi:ABC-type uncharacterized transport system involved in gliding motility auxiliary subunit